MEKGCRNCMCLYHMVTYNPTAPCSECLDYNKWQTAKTTHYDEIRAMSVEKLAEFHVGQGCPPGVDVYEQCDEGNAVPPVCFKCWKTWLQQEAK